MQESKYQVANWKKWKATRNLLASTKNELMNDIKAINYSNELPGSGHIDVIEKYNKLIDDVKIYDEYIRAYDVVINHLENAITKLLNEEQRMLVLIYANYRDSKKREEESLKKGISRTDFYRKLSEIFNILDEVLDSNKIGTNLGLNKPKNVLL